METTVATSTVAAATLLAPRDGPSQSTRSRDNLAVVAARNVSGGTVTRSQVLPTPPNSISPALGPHSLRAQHRSREEETKIEPVDSDLDLQDTDSTAADALAHNETGSITSTMLARHYLPDILLSQGPLAIRHITGFLTTAVPGFAAIPPTKARRLVVAALEGRNGGGEGETEEDDDADTVFEKVGWGRWEAHRCGHPIRHRRSTPPRERAGSPYARALPIPRGGGQGRLGGASSGVSGKQAHPRRTRPLSNTSIAFSYGSYDHRSKMECETDKMSLDGSASPPCSDDEGDVHADNDVDLDANLDIYMNDDPEDATDDEDWAAMGAAALREASYPSSAATPVTDGRGIFRVPVPASFGSRSVPSRAVAAARRSIGPSIDTSNLAATSNAQERAAIEALLSLGSM